MSKNLQSQQPFLSLSPVSKAINLDDRSNLDGDSSSDSLELLSSTPIDLQHFENRNGDHVKKFLRIALLYFRAKEVFAGAGPKFYERMKRFAISIRWQKMPYKNFEILC